MLVGFLPLKVWAYLEIDTWRFILQGYRWFGMAPCWNRSRELGRRAKFRCLRRTWHCCLLLLLSSYWIWEACLGLRTQNSFSLIPNVINAHFLCSTIIHNSPKKQQVSCPCSKEILKRMSPASHRGPCQEPVNFVTGETPKTRGEGRISGRQLFWALPCWLAWMSRDLVSAHLIIHRAKRVSTGLRAESFNLGSKALQCSMWLHPNPCVYFIHRGWGGLKIIGLRKQATCLQVRCEGWPGNALLQYGASGLPSGVQPSRCCLVHGTGGARAVAEI